MFPRISNMKSLLKEKKQNKTPMIPTRYLFSSCPIAHFSERKKMYLKKNLVSHICKLFKNTCLFDKDCHLVITCYTNLNVYTSIYL